MITDLKTKFTFLGDGEHEGQQAAPMANQMAALEQKVAEIAAKQNEQDAIKTK